jgi:hypothetical protein
MPELRRWPSLDGQGGLIPPRVESDSQPQEGKCQGSSSFLKKRTKKLLPVSPAGSRSLGSIAQKFFVSFFQKRNASLLRQCVAL